jgi:hypothetical protein
MITFRFFLLMMLSLCAGCSSVNSALGGNSEKDALAEAKYPADPRGVVMKVQSSRNLNLFSGLPHTVAIAVIQGNNPKAIRKLAQNAVELDNLLSGKPASDAAIVGVDRLIVQPGAADVTVMARRADAQVVLVYAGYYNATLEQRTRMIEVPINVSSKGIIVSTHTAKPIPMYLSLILDEANIQSLSIHTPGEKSVFPSGNDPELRGEKIQGDPDLLKVMPL